MTRAAIYSRYSSDRQSEASCEDQIRECRRFAEAKGWTIAEGAVVSEEGISRASRHNRPGLLALVAEAGAGFDVLVTYDVSRLGRNDEDVAWLRNRLDERGVRCVEAASGEDLASLSSKIRGIRTRAAWSRLGPLGACGRSRLPSLCSVPCRLRPERRAPGPFLLHLPVHELRR